MAEPLSVLYIVAGFSLETLGGVERYTLDLSRALSRQGLRVGIAGIWQFDTPYESAWMQRLNAVGVETFVGCRKDERAPLRNLLASITQLRRELKGRQFDVVHSQQEFGDVVALALRRTLHPRLVVRSVHNDIEWRMRPWRRLLLSNVLLPLMFDEECGITPVITARLNRRPIALLLERQAMLIPNAIDLSRFENVQRDRARSRRMLGWPEGAFIIVSIGRLTEQKGYIYLIEATARLRQQLPVARVYIVGEGELRETLQMHIAQLDLQDTVALVGSLQNVTDVYTAADLFVSSSLWEGLPTVILEAMAMQTPVVATDIEGTRYLVQHERTGLLVPPADPDALASAVMRASQESARMRTMAQAALERVREFSIEHVTGRLVQLYRQHLV
jgi:glycosyltransferase involved in cell wall biosynthesis